MELLQQLLASGRIADLALGVLVLELAALLVYQSYRTRRSKLRAMDLIGQLLAGAFLLLGLRSVLVGADFRWTLLWLTASFPAHLFDVARRLRHASID